ncbi:S8 family serine peptidase [Actinoallomurus soli]|uniref:S8 family serine peptidase n=1 Tax=Actinoallomurus soli TaxID=2952535 RepID=UPI002092AC1A|nr:S8 family serine peptidase [Actinoallomurus soli]MCO5968782.1 S8 family serine peptidase [Actinoallomurus soli]
MRKLLAGAAVIGALGMFPSPVQALPRAAVPTPRSDEWWFSPWSIPTKVWPISQGQGVTVAVLDTGVNGDMPEIAGALVPGSDMTGHGTDGHTDLGKTGHGTGMSILIAGQGGGTTHLVGVAPAARILPVVVSDDSASTSDFEQALARGIRFATDHGAKVINISQGDDAGVACPTPVLDAVSYAVAHDVVLVAGAGNDGDKTNPVMYPASCPGVLSVGATDDYSRPWKSTESNRYVSVAAPGVDIPTAGKSEDYSYAHSAGTSIATALVSGAAALVRSANPSMPAREVVRRLIGTALDVSTPGRDDQTGYGIVRINRAMQPAAFPVPAGSPNPPYERFDQWKHPQSTPTRAPVGAAPAKKSGKGISTNWILLLALLGLVVLAVIGMLIGRARGAQKSGDGRPDFLGRRGGPGVPPHEPPAREREFTMPDPAAHEPPGRGPSVPPMASGGAPPDGFDGRTRPTFYPPADDGRGDPPAR